MKTTKILAIILVASFFAAPAFGEEIKINKDLISNGKKFENPVDLEIFDIDGTKMTLNKVYKITVPKEGVFVFLYFGKKNKTEAFGYEMKNIQKIHIKN